MTFTDGTTFDAAAVKANLDKFLEPGLRAGGRRRAADATSQAVEVVDPRTVRHAPEAPDVLFLDFLASPYGAQVSPEVAAGGARTSRPAAPTWSAPARSSSTATSPARNCTTGATPATTGRRRPPATPGPAHLDRDHLPLPQGGRGPGRRAHLRPGTGHRGRPRHRPATDQRRPRPAPDPRSTPAPPTPTTSTSPTPPSTTCGSARRSGRPSTSTPCSPPSTRAPPPGRGAWSARPARSTTSALEGTLRRRHRQANAPARRGRLDGARRRGLPDQGRPAAHRTAGAGGAVRPGPPRHPRPGRPGRGQAERRHRLPGHPRRPGHRARRPCDDNEYEVFENSRADTDAGAALNLLLHSGGGINRTRINDPQLDRLLDAGSGHRRPDPAGRRLYADLQQRVVADQALAAAALRPGRPDRRQHQRRGVRFEPTAGSRPAPYDLWIGER